MKRPRQDHRAGAHDGKSVDLPAAVVAAGLVDRLQHIQAALVPVIGQGGVLALYERSRHLCSRSYPWLEVPEDSIGRGMDLQGLRLLIARQNDDAAAAGAGFLLESLHKLLAGLVGASLTTELIGPTPGADTEADKTS